MIPTPGKLRRKIGDLKIEKNRIDFGKVKDTDILIDTLKIQNSNPEPVEILFEDIPPYIQIDLNSMIIQPRQKENMIITFDISKKNEYGLLGETLKLKTKRSSNEKRGSITLNADVVEDFSLLTPMELENAPQIHFFETKKNIGTINMNDTINVNFEFENKGKRDLIIRSIKIRRRGLTVANYDEIVKPGRSGKIELTLNPHYFAVSINIDLTVIANDPKNNISKLKILANMIKDKPEIKDGKFSRIIYPTDAYKLIKKNASIENFMILDVRTPKEYAEGHLENAVNIDYYSSSFYQFMQMLDKKNIYLVYCKTDIRSMDTLKLMRELNFENIYIMKNGFEGWKKADFPILKD